MTALHCTTEMYLLGLEGSVLGKGNRAGYETKTSQKWGVIFIMFALSRVGENLWNLCQLLIKPRNCHADKTCFLTVKNLVNTTSGGHLRRNLASVVSKSAFSESCDKKEADWVDVKVFTVETPCWHTFQCDGGQWHVLFSKQAYICPYWNILSTRAYFSIHGWN